jgi:hypothetical protein
MAMKMFDNNKTHKEIAEALGRTTCSVAHKLWVMGVKRDFGSNGISLGRPPTMKGKKHSEEAKQKMRDKAKKRFADVTKHPLWKGGRRISSNGYVEILNREHPRNRNGYVFEHILVMERMLDRYLTKDEVVHHINQNKQDNRVENLMLFQNRQDHTAYHKNLRLIEVEKYYEQSNVDRKING